jgi:hypothetical protein
MEVVLSRLESRQREKGFGESARCGANPPGGIAL